MAEEAAPLSWIVGLSLDEVLDPLPAAPGSLGFEVFGRFWSRMRMMAARCVPASTASTDPFAQLVAVDLTSRPVTLSSLGPPPAPLENHC